MTVRTCKQIAGVAQSVGHTTETATGIKSKNLIIFLVHFYLDQWKKELTENKISFKPIDLSKVQVRASL